MLKPGKLEAFTADDVPAELLIEMFAVDVLT